MILFTPNTVIKSADMNANFNEQTTSITNLQTPSYATGSVNADVGAGFIGLTQTASSGITFDNVNKYTVTIKGFYWIHGQQLISTGGAAVYWGITINGSFTKYGYINGSTSTTDAIASDLRELNIGDTIQFKKENANTSAWGSPHSGYQIFLIKRT